MTDHVITLGYIAQLIEIYGPAKPAIKDFLVDELLVDEMIFLDGGGKYQVTSKGVAWMEMLRTTPFPELRWVRPRHIATPRT